MHREQDYIGKQFLNTFIQILLPTLQQAFLYIVLSVFSIVTILANIVTSITLLTNGHKLTSATLAKSKAVSSSEFCNDVSAPAATSKAVCPLSPYPAAR